MQEFKSLPPEDSLIRTISGVGGQGARLLPTPTVQSRRLRAAGLVSPPVPASEQGQWSLPAVQCVLELGAGVAKVEAFFSDGVIRVESHQDRVSRRVHLLWRLTEEEDVCEAEAGRGPRFSFPKVPCSTEGGQLRLSPNH